ncbi:MAG TPA: MATE family efflux transporter [Clostridium sp.]|nr:MATE family efflux transporter [Clostridium sp. Bc-iso-3]HHV29495.1 MATE family efflux transporter [Clostridium sp.]
MERYIFRDFIKYVSLNVLGMIGLSCYILADTFFISKALGPIGIAALNFSISIYSLIHGVGLMIGIGGAARYSILKSRNEEKDADIVFSTCLKLGVIIGVIFAIIGIFGSRSLASILGADMSTLPMTKTYLTTILCFAPFFIVNNILLAFIRNDNNPNLSMIAMLTGSFSNIILDYVFMFPLGMGMFGAAFATCLAPIISIGILSIHFIKRKNNFGYIQSRMPWFSICDVFSLGLSSFITEVSSSVVLITFNLVILGLRGNLGVASYGIVANIALVGIAVFSGIAQGIQPLVSKEYGLKNYKAIREVLKYALFTSLTIATVIYLGMFFYADNIINIFNGEQNLEIARITKTGLRIYFIGFFFAGINLIMAMYLSATEQARYAFIISVARGCIIIVPLVLLLSRMWEMTGVWMAFVLTEVIVTVITVLINNRQSLLV